MNVWPGSCVHSSLHIHHVLAIYLIYSTKEFTGFEWALMTQTMENAKGVVFFCPMLAILFVGTRMRALMLTDWKGAPQGWCQDGMYTA